MFNCDFWKEKRIGIRCVRQEEVKWGRTMNRKLTLKTLLRVPGVEAFKLQANLVINEGHTRNESSSFRGACFCTESFFARSKVSCTTEEDFWGGGGKRGVWFAQVISAQKLVPTFLMMALRVTKDLIQRCNCSNSREKTQRLEFINRLWFTAILFIEIDCWRIRWGLI